MKIQLQSLLLSVLIFVTLSSYSQNCGGIFTDSGGVNGNYSTSENITTTICPDNAGDVVTVVFSSFETEAIFDILKIYDGDNTGAPLLGEFDGTNSPGVITASAANGGCLTFLFTSDASLSKSGWVASVNCSLEPTCITPSLSVNQTNITTDAAEITIVDANSVGNWEIEYGISGFAHGTGIVDTTTTNTHQISGLSSDTEYDVYTRSNCGNGDFSFWFGPVTFRTEISCFVVESFGINNITTTSAELTWTDINTPTATNWTLLYGEQGFDVDVAGTTISTATNSITLSGLNSNTQYDVYIQTNCGANVGDDDSQWIGPYQFSTLCDTITAPYVEDFESSGMIPSCWSQGSSNTDMWLFSNETYHTHIGNNGQVNSTTNSGGYFAYIDDLSQNNTTMTLVSPMIDISNLQNPELSFYIISDNEGNTNSNFSVDIWDGAQWNVGVYTSNTNTVEWKNVYVDLTTLNISGDIQARFIVDGSTSYTDDIAIDDVRFDEAITCREIDGILVSNITENSATITWNDTNSTSPIGWEIELVDTAESPTGTGVLVSDLTYTFNNLLPLRNYDVFIRTQCTSTEYSEWRKVTGFITQSPSAIDIPYSVNSVPFQLYTANNLLSFNRDDRYSNLFNIGFNFNFFGYDYGRLTISDNGVVSFDPSDARQLHDWNLTGSIPIPSNQYSDNAIFGVFQDLLNVNGSGLIAVGEKGTAPFRKFIVVYENVPMFSCTDMTATNQIILYETYNFIDVQIKDRNVCANWNDGNAILGIQSIGGQYAYFPPNRNIGSWGAHNEGWRFRPIQNHPEYQYIVCDSNNDGIENFDLNVIINHFNDGSGNQYALFVSEADAINNTNEITGTYTNTSNTQTIYLRDFDGTTATIRTVLLSVIDCAVDYDSDTVQTADEDLNGNGNYGDDDTDGDNIPDFLDEDDDGDFVLTNAEAVITINRSGLNTTQYLDTDGDQIPNYIDEDDDNDGILTVDEDYNGDNNPANDDTDNSGVADYLERNVALATEENQVNTFSIHPNPVKDNLTIAFAEGMEKVTIKIYSLQGKEVYVKTNVNETVQVNVSGFSTGVYFVNVVNNKQVSVQKFVKK